MPPGKIPFPALNLFDDLIDAAYGSLAQHVEPLLRIIMRGYFDESGTHDSSPVTTVAGWVSDAPHWRKCLIEWEAALDKQHIKQFHANDFKRFDPAVFKSLVGIITKYAFFGVSGSVVTSAYNDLPEWVKKRIGGRYHFCFYVMMDMLHKRMRNIYHRDPLTFYFEINSGMGRIADNFRRDFSHTDYSMQHLNGCFFGTKEQHSLLQTADFLVYEINRWIDEALIQGKDPRETIKDLAKARKVTFGYHDAETLAGWQDELEKDRKKLESGRPEHSLWWPASWHRGGSMKHPKLPKPAPSGR